MKRMSTGLATASVALVMACAWPASQAQSVDFRLGSAIEASHAQRSIIIVADTRWANAKHGESIRFVSGASEFGWKFDGTVSNLDLSKLAPAGFLARPFTVYVASPVNIRGGN